VFVAPKWVSFYPLRDCTELLFRLCWYSSCFVATVRKGTTVNVGPKCEKENKYWGIVPEYS
jgi:hypothetical protein